MRVLTVSVIMLTYNRRALVGKMAADLCAQSHDTLEFIIVDNGSDDGTAEFVDDLARNDARIRVLHLPKSSIGRGRNAGVAAATGQYVTFVDDDDRVDTDYVAFLLEMTQGGLHDITICGTDETEDGVHFVPQCVFEGQRIVGPEEAVRLLLERKQIRAGMPGKLVRASVLRRYPFREDCVHEDIFTTYKYLSEAGSVVMNGKPAYHLLRHATNCSLYTSDAARWTPALLDEYMLAFAERTRFVSERFLSLGAFARYAEWSYMLSMLEKIKRYDLRDCFMQRVQMRQVLSSNIAEFCTSSYLKDFERDWLRSLSFIV